jgi:antitoxin (DNA-binding transcriptional repressor) of toxin-antitoxin stability system
MGSVEARRDFRDLLDEVERGGLVGVERHGRHIGVFVPESWFQRAAAAMAAQAGGVTE